MIVYPAEITSTLWLRNLNDKHEFFYTNHLNDTYSRRFLEWHFVAFPTEKNAVPLIVLSRMEGIQLVWLMIIIGKTVLLKYDKLEWDSSRAKSISTLQGIIQNNYFKVENITIVKMRCLH